MKRRAVLATAFSALAVSLAGCGKPKSKFKSYSGPEVTRVVVMKSDRRMYLMHHQKVLKAYDVHLGFAPEGHKQFEGDGKTPEGAYLINRRNPNSTYHLSIGISYPNEQDREFAKAHNKSPGGDIFIHGGPRPGLDPSGPDWTVGCVAVTNDEVEDVYAMVKNGTQIDIFA